MLWLDLNDDILSKSLKGVWLPDDVDYGSGVWINLVYGVGNLYFWASFKVDGGRDIIGLLFILSFSFKSASPVILYKGDYDLSLSMLVLLLRD
jgi:hypothetical protein